MNKVRTTNDQIMTNGRRVKAKERDGLLYACNWDFGGFFPREVFSNFVVRCNTRTDDYKHLCHNQLLSVGNSNYR